jgi:dUTP pyrophosphatase
MIDVKIHLLTDNSKLPTKATDGAAAYDVYTPRDVIVHDGRQIIPLGFAIELPQGYAAEIRSRSGFASKGIEGYRVRSVGRYGIDGAITYKQVSEPTQLRFDADVITGLVDCDYRGEVGAIINNHDKSFMIKRGTRIAQMLIIHAPETKLIPTRQLSPTNRAGGGFGSTGSK